MIETDLTQRLERIDLLTVPRPWRYPWNFSTTRVPSQPLDTHHRILTPTRAILGTRFRLRSLRFCYTWPSQRRDICSGVATRATSSFIPHTSCSIGIGYLAFRAVPPALHSATMATGVRRNNKHHHHKRRRSDRPDTMQGRADTISRLHQATRPRVASSAYPLASHNPDERSSCVPSKARGVTPMHLAIWLLSLLKISLPCVMDRTYT